MILDRLATTWVRLAYRARIPVLVLALLGSALAANYVRDNLGINTDTADMISPSLPWRQRYIDYQDQFPHASNTLVLVLEAQTPDLAEQAAQRLADSLSRMTDLFHEVQWPQGHAFFRGNALVFMDAQPRRELMDRLITAQPLLGRLHRDPGLAGVVALLDDALAASASQPAADGVTPELVDRFVDAFARSVEAVLDGDFHSLSWRRLVGGDVDHETLSAHREILTARPVLDYNQLFPAARAQSRIRDEARRLGLTPERGVVLRITGGVAMSEEELRSVSSGALRTAALALLGVTLVLALGLGSLRMVVVTLITLLAGLTWTAAFAALAVGHLNMISVAFAVLYIGLGVDYAVHFGLRFRELRSFGTQHVMALEQAARDVGGALALCAVTTGVGFFAFLPTEFAGVSELGLIAGVGMFISLAATLTLMPALLSFLPPGSGRGLTLPLGAALDRLGRRHGRGVRLGALLVAVCSAVAALGVRFDDNPLNLRDPAGEAVSTYRALVADGNTWSLDLLARDASEAKRVAVALEALPEVKRVLSLGSFVPAGQAQAIEDLEELALLLGPDLAGPPADPGEPATARPALQALTDRLADSPSASPARERLGRALARLERRMDDAADAGASLLAALDQSVAGMLPAELTRLAQTLEGDRVTPESLPAFLRRDWRGGDGRLRLRVDAAGDLNDRATLVAFVDAVRTVAPGAVGTPIVHLESARVVVGAFVQAFALALASIVVILFLVLRRTGAVVMALVPLLLASLATVGVLSVLQIPFNFANVIALPLLLGVGVDSGIHMLTRARMSDPGGSLAASGTARGVVTSAVTTVVSFGNLAFSAHPGTASMGVVLSVGMICVLAATLVVMPAIAPLCLERDLAATRR